MVERWLFCSPLTQRVKIYYANIVWRDFVKHTNLEPHRCFAMLQRLPKESQSKPFQKFHRIRFFLKSDSPWILQYQKKQQHKSIDSLMGSYLSQVCPRMVMNQKMDQVTLPQKVKEPQRATKGAILEIPPPHGSLIFLLTYLKEVEENGSRNHVHMIYFVLSKALIIYIEQHGLQTKLEPFLIQQKLENSVVVTQHRLNVNRRLFVALYIYIQGVPLLHLCQSSLCGMPKLYILDVTSLPSLP